MTLVSPTNNQSFTAGNSIQIVANATDNDKVSELHIHVNNLTTGLSIKDVHAYPASPTFTIKDSVTAQGATDYIIRIMAYDAKRNLASSQVEVRSN